MAQPRSGTSESTAPLTVRSWVVVVGTVSVFVGIFATGTFTRDAVRNWDRYTVTFADIDCTAPAGVERPLFLAEVQYLGGMPDRLSILGDKVPSRLADAFARHPLVETVQSIAVYPARQVAVRLEFRGQSRRGEIARR